MKPRRRRVAQPRTLSQQEVADFLAEIKQWKKVSPDMASRCSDHLASPTAWNASLSCATQEGIPLIHAAMFQKPLWGGATDQARKAGHLQKQLIADVLEADYALAQDLLSQSPEEQQSLVQTLFGSHRGRPLSRKQLFAHDAPRAQALRMQKTRHLPAAPKPRNVVREEWRNETPGPFPHVRAEPLTQRSQSNAQIVPPIRHPTQEPKLRNVVREKWRFETPRTTNRRDLAEPLTQSSQAHAQMVPQPVRHPTEEFPIEDVIIPKEEKKHTWPFDQKVLGSKFLNKGASGEVHRHEFQTGAPIAVKKQILSTPLNPDMFREWYASAFFSHPDILNMLDVGLSEDGRHIRFAFPPAESSLSERLLDVHNLPPEDFVILLQQIF